MSSRHQALFLFDIDGTLLHGSTEVHRRAFQHAYETVYGLPLNLDGIAAAGRTDTWLLAEALRRHGMSDSDIWRRMPDAFEVMQEYVDRYLGDLRHTVLPGVEQVLAGLHGRGQLLGLVTGNLSRVAMAKMRQARLARYFDTGGFGEESEIRAHLVPVALDNAGQVVGHAISPAHAVVIGDTPMDVEAGKTSGTKTVAVATGPFSTEDLNATGADVVLPSLEHAEECVGILMSLGLERVMNWE